MPKFKNELTEIAFSEKYAEIKEQRRGIIADLIKQIAPTEIDYAIPKRRIAALIVKTYAENAQAIRTANPFLSEHSDKFISVKSILVYWSDVKELLAEEGITAAWTSQGVFLTSDDDEILRCFKQERAIIAGNVEHHNTRAESTNKIKTLQVPIMAVQLLLAE
jgi:hypothetical protein